MELDEDCKWAEFALRHIMEEEKARPITAIPTPAEEHNRSRQLLDDDFDNVPDVIAFMLAAVDDFAYSRIDFGKLKQHLEGFNRMLCSLNSEMRGYPIKNVSPLPPPKKRPKKAKQKKTK